MASKSRRIANINGALVGPLNAVPSVDNSKGLVANAVKASPSQQRDATKQILLAIKQFVEDSRQNEILLDAKMSDVLLGRIASLMDEVMASFADDQLVAMKKEILDEVSGLTASGVLKNFLLGQLAELFDTDAKKEDIEELKTWMTANFGSTAKPTEPLAEAEDEEESGGETAGEYDDSTSAKNFQTLQNFIEGQMKALNTNISKMTCNFGIISTIAFGLSKTIGGIAKGVAFVAKGVAKTISKTASIAKSIVAVPIKGIVAGIVGLTKGIKGIASGIVGIGKKVGGALAFPFKAIGGFFSKLNPFSRNKKEEKKQKLKDRIMDKVVWILDKMWKAVEPFIDKAVMYMTSTIVSVVAPIALIAAKVLLIVGILVLIGLWLYLAYKLVTAKVKQFWNYVTSGQMWEDIKAKLLAAWERLKDFGAWLWGKLCEFGKWLYENYIYKYLVKPFMDYIWNPLKNFWNTKVWPVIEPFVKSLIELKDKIVQAFSAWDTNLSIWDNLKNMTGIIKDAVLEWWDSSPFKTFYETYLEPFVNDIKAFVGRVIDAFKGWDPSKSFLDNLKCIGTILIASLKEWYAGSTLKFVIDEILNNIKLYVIAPLTGLIRKLKSLLVKASNFQMKLPTIETHGSMNPFKWDFGLIETKPFGFLTSGMTSQQIKQAQLDSEKPLSDLINEEMTKTQKELDKANNIDKIAQKDLAAQQVSQAAAPLQSIDSIKQQQSIDLKKSGDVVAKDIQKKEAMQQKYDAALMKKLDENNALVKANLEATNKYGKDPTVLFAPTPVPSDHNSASMEDN